MTLKDPQSYDKQLCIIDALKAYPIRVLTWVV